MQADMHRMNEMAALVCGDTANCAVQLQGVLYSHRSNFLHALIVVSKDMIGLDSTSCFCALVPLYHANSWGLVFAAPMMGSRLVLPGQPAPSAMCTFHVCRNRHTYMLFAAHILGGRLVLPGQQQHLPCTLCIWIHTNRHVYCSCLSGRYTRPCILLLPCERGCGQHLNAVLLHHMHNPFILTPCTCLLP